ncbi:MAG: hypothetical protein D6775_04815, partial [Caldilineae bacterium]
MFSLRRKGRLLGLFILLALVTTWPLITRITGQVPGSDTWAYDEYTFIWSMWWFKYSLLDLHSSIFFSQYIFYPLGMELILYSYNLMAAILALPAGVAFGWPLAANLTLLFSMVVSGLGAYLLAAWSLKRWGVPTSSGPGMRLGAGSLQAAAVIAGLIYAFASNRMVYLALGHYNIQSWQFLPFFVLYLLRTLENPRARNILLTGLFGALNLLVDMQYGVFMVFLGACLLLARPLRAYLFGRPPDVQRWLALISAGLVAVAITWPYFWQTVQSFLHADYLLRGWGDALKLSADLVGWFTPTALHPLWGADWVRRLRQVQEGTAPFNDVNTVFLGYLTFALAVVGGVVAWRRARGWVLAALFSALFTLGPLLQINGTTRYNLDGLETTVPMPFLLLHYIPFVRGNRAANRWSIVLMLAVAMLVAWGLAELLERVRRRIATLPPYSDSPLAQFGHLIPVVVAGLILFEHLAIPLPLTDARIPKAIQQLAALPEGAVLQIPMGWRNSFGVLGAERTQAQYYMSAHHKPILSGNTSRNAPIKFEYFRRLPLVQAITQVEFGHTPDAELLAAARAQAQALVDLWGVRYLLLLPPVPGRLPYADTWRASWDLALDLIPHSNEPLIDHENIQVWLVEPGAPLPLALDFGAENTDAWRGEGWSVDEPDVGGANGIWATGRKAQLIFRSEDERPRRLRFRAVPFQWPNAGPQFLIFRLNGRRIGQVTLAPEWKEYTFELTPRAGINHLWLEFSRADSPRRVLGQAQIGNTGVQAPVNIEVHSFDQAFITLFTAEGEEIAASSGRRGYNVTVLERS